MVWWRLIGRKPDIAAVRNALLRGEVRLLTLLGPPGIGKTSLSLAVARDVQAAFSDGASFVALAPIGDPSLVIATIAQTLGVQETAAWSYELLDPGEQTLFRRLGVFAGGWTLEAAEFICASEGIATADVLNLLSQLVDKSLVLVEERADEMHYRLLETIRQYAQEKLSEARELEHIALGRPFLLNPL